jgi:hypothetical protein
MNSLCDTITLPPMKYVLLGKSNAKTIETKKKSTTTFPNQIVFSEAGQLDKLNGIVWPHIERMAREQVEANKDKRKGFKAREQVEANKDKRKGFIESERNTSYRNI